MLTMPQQWNSPDIDHRFIPPASKDDSHDSTPQRR